MLTHCEETGSLASDRMNDVNEFDVCPDRILNTACSHVLMLLNIFTEKSGKTTAAASFTKTFISKNEVKTTQLPPPGPVHHHGLNRVQVRGATPVSAHC